uniref:Putative WRKY transcription factor 19 n=1 Tax=Anthurium amnicola TaxID=1678845 RepID=A0A1D1ZK21_9ARAE
MDLNMNNLLFRKTANCKGHDKLGDTTLSLDCFGYGTCKATGSGASLGNVDDLSTQDDGCRLVLGLGPTLSSYSNNYFSFEYSTARRSTTTHTQSLGLDFHSGMLELGQSKGAGDTALSMTLSNQNSTPLQTPSPVSEKCWLDTAADENSTSARRNFGGYMPTLLLAPRPDDRIGCIGMTGTKKVGASGTDPCVADKDTNHNLQSSPNTSAANNCSAAAILEAVDYGVIPHGRTHHHHPKKCRFKGCFKGARGASGLCIAHGGGQRCYKPGCNKGSESRTAYCKAHGGGRRCQQLGCTKSAEGMTDFCIAHGGGRRCGHPGCKKAARGRSGLCIRHGGGKRCTVAGCTGSAEGKAGLCISHGGGRRCQFPGCHKGAQGSTMHCKAHGGGRRCIFEGCTKGAEGSTPLCKGHGGGKRCLYEGGGVCAKSVHGGTDYCVAHGGGKRCAVAGCTKSARGRTDCCVKHGGGKRCKSEGCGKSAQGSTDFCKAHGGGKKCSWGQGCEKFARGKNGLCAAHGSMVISQQEQEAGKSSSLIGPGLFHGLLSASVTTVSVYNEYSSSAVSTPSDCCIESSDSMGRRQVLIPPQVLVPLSMKSASTSFGLVGGDRSSGFVVPEGRVHGGGLMSLFGGDLKNALDAGLEL